ncbi:MAG: PQQ-dependent sugar dehydrogenase [Planctomycetes bacterium]|nr:PQQ-dependent sugar dehydrogenase [Planctomycetota bacterium]
MRFSSLLSASLVLLLTLPAAAQFRARPLVSGLSGALYATYAPGDPSRLFVVLQSGTIRVVRDGVLLPAPFLSVTTRILTGSERGLLGLAFAPDYQTSGSFYISYTRSGDGASIVARYRVSANPDVGDVGSEQIVYGPIAQPYSNHNGGCIQFGPDGYLYFGLGDGGSGGDPGCRAQNLQTPLGKMLRLDVSTTPASAPATNPFFGNPAGLDVIWAYGLRNPWRFSFDSLTGDLWIGDVGQSALEEIDFQPAASAGGENYGWKIMEGTNCYSTAACPSGVPTCNSPALTLPVYAYGRTLGQAVTGGYVYRGCAIPSLRGTYFFGDYSSGRVWSLRLVNGTVTQYTDWTSRLGTIAGLSSFGQDLEGELLLVSIVGTVYRLESTIVTANDLGFGTAGQNGIPAFSVCGLLTAGESAEFRVDRGLPNAPGALLLGLQNNPTTIAPFGIVVPTPLIGSLPLATDALGRVRFTLPGGTGAATVYAQTAIADPVGPGNIALSNALEVFFR